MAEVLEFEVPQEFETDAQLDTLDAVRQLGEALDRAKARLFAMSSAERQDLYNIDSGTPPFDHDYLSRAAIRLMLDEPEMQLPIYIGPAAERLRLERDAFQGALIAAQADLALTRIAYRELREDLQLALGGPIPMLTLLQLLELAQQRTRDAASFASVMGQLVEQIKENERRTQAYVAKLKAKAS